MAVKISEVARQPVFVFPGQGSQWLGMGRELSAREPVFRGALERCDRWIREYGGFSLLAQLTATPGRSRLASVEVTQPAIFAIQVALAELWRAWGVEAAALVGHSTGEVAASCAAGCLSLEEAARLICLQGALLTAVRGQGAMAAVELPAAEARRRLASYGERLAVAVVMSPESSVLSGEPAALDEVLRCLEHDGIFCRRVRADTAGHCSQVDAVSCRLAAQLAGLEPRPARRPLYSSVTGDRVDGTELDGAFWGRCLRSQVRFADVIERLLRQGYRVFLELSPHPIVLPAIRQASRGHDLTLLPSLHRDAGEHSTMTASRDVLEALGAPRPRSAAERQRLTEDVRRILRAARRPEMGLDSLMAVELQHTLESELGLRVSMADLLAGGSLAELAEHLSGRLGNEAARSVPIPGPRPRPGEDGPLSHGQEALWFLERLAPSSTAYHVGFAVEVRSLLDAGALKRALAALSDRHACLRATFHAPRGMPSQRFHARLEPDFLHQDTVGSNAAELAERLVRERDRPFDLEEGPLLRVAIFSCSPRRHVLGITLHHVIADFWSLTVILRDLGALYTRESDPRRREPAESLPPLPLSFTDFVRWQRQLVAGTEGKRQETWWRRQLAGLPDLELPYDHAPPASRSYRGAGCGLWLRDDLVAGLRSLAAARGATLFMTLLASFQVLLYRYTGQRDLAVGSPAAGRGTTALTDLVGHFVNTLVLRADLSGEPNFEAFLARTRRGVLGALAHQDYPFALLVERLRPERDASRAPLVQVFFVLEKAPGKAGPGLAAAVVGHAGGGLDLGGLAAKSMRLEETASLVDLTLRLAEVEGSVAACIQYDVDLFERSTIERLAGHLRSLLAAATSRPESPVSALALLTAAERHEVVVEPGSAAAEIPVNRCLHVGFELQAQRRPQAVALVFEDRALSYRELDRRANRLAHRLADSGVGPETRVGISVERGLEMVAAILGVLKSGGAYVPLDPAYPPSRLELMARDAGIARLLTREELTRSFAGLAPGARSPRSPVRPDNAAYVIYTSGSTGRPKGVTVSHANVVRLIEATAGSFAFGPSEVWALFHSYAFDFSVWEMWGALTHGGRLVVVPGLVSRSPELLHRLLVEEGVTVLNQTPSAFRQLDEVDESAEPTQLAVRQVIFGGEALELESLRGWLARHGERRPRLVNMYGITETTVHVTFRPLCRADPDRPVTGTLGRPLADLSLYVLDPRGWPVPAGIAGELHVGGAGVSRGYLRRPARTAERFLPDPFAAGGRRHGGRLYRTGDRVRARPGGSLDFLGRLDDQIQLRGFRVELGEVEATLERHPAVGRAVAAVRADAGEGPRLVAYVVARQDGAAPDPAGLRRFLSRQLPEFMVPAAFVTLPALPLLPSGKVERRALPRPDSSAYARSRRLVAPRTPLEEVLAGIWGRVLGLGHLGIHDNFFRLGGHSLLAVRVSSAVRRSLGQELAVREIFERPTVAELAAGLEARMRDPTGQSVSAPEPPLGPVPRQGELPLSFAQERLWFLDQLDPGLGVYNVPAVFRFRGTLDLGALEASLCEIVRRHEVLRTSFAAAGGRAHPRVAADTALSLPVVDLAALAAGPARAEARRLSSEETRARLDLACGPLRVRLLRLERREHLLLRTLHHIVCDGWSEALFERELVTLYGTFCRRLPPALPELPIQYADFAHWQRRWLDGDATETLLGYWRRQLAGAPLSELPTDRPRPAGPTWRGACQTLELSAELTEALRELCLASGATLFMAALAALMALVARYTGQRDVVVGTPVDGRQRQELEGLIGLFVNTLVLRAGLAGRPGFRELLERARDSTLEACAHQELPFERLVKELAPARDPSRNPFFQVLLVRQGAPEPEVEVAELAVSRLTLAATTAKLDLELHLWERAGSCRVEAVYNVDLFTSTTLARLLRHFEALLQGAVADCERRIDDLDVLSPAERHQLLAEWNGHEEDLSRQELLHELFEARAARIPDAVAVTFGERSLTYRELDRQSRRLAAFLVEAGVGPEVLVGICAERSLEMVVGVLATLRAGGAYVPMDPAYPAPRLVSILSDAGIRLLLTQQRLVERLAALRARVVRLDADLPLLSPRPGNPPRPASANTAYVIYTSGSTGRPKGVAVCHGSAVRLFRATEPLFHFAAGDVRTLFHSFAFDVSVWEMWGALLYGGRLVVVPHAVSCSPELFHELLLEQGVTVLNQIPSAFRHFMEADRNASSCGELKLRLVILGGEALEPASLRLWVEGHGDGTASGRGPRLVNMYGPTETTVFVTSRPLTALDVSGGAPSVIGTPLADNRTYVLDRDLRRLPIGVPGELHIGGAGLARGYLGDPRKTAERFVPDPFGRRGGRLYRSGDLVRTSTTGELEYLGRIDRQVKVRGFRIEPREVESVLERHPAVRAAAVLARPGPGGHQRLVAYVEPRPEGNGSEVSLPARLRDLSRQTLPEYMVPMVVVLEALPLSPNGKVDRAALGRAALVQPETADRKGAPAPGAPRTPAERRVAAIWREVLEVGEVGVDEKFFDVGGHSLLLPRLRRKLCRQFGPGVTIVHLFSYPTIRSLARFLSPEESRDDASSPLAEHAPVADDDRASEMAIVGMAGRFPGSPDLTTFWRHLCEGVESITFFSPEELLAAGLPAELVDDPRYVPARGVLEGAELFDAELFGFHPREAEMTDPQHRVLLECAWEALENAGYSGERFDGGIGVYVGASRNDYALGLRGDPWVDDVQLRISTGQDFLPTQISYKLSLKGPSVNVQSACSTSLVAVHLACRALAAGECDLALAGGVSIFVPQTSGYLYREAGILSPDGHCRAFDAAARGTVPGSGAGLVVLKRLREALADGDVVHAVIKGSAVNNDGSLKVGYTAPGVAGQKEVIEEAHRRAGVDPRTLSYVEAHGTGTALGDPVEVAALERAFRRSASCAIGSVKSNIGHLDAAAGIAGLIKTVLALEHRQIPASLNYREPNPEIDFTASPFYVNTELRPWPAGAAPRRAGVSSFGLGGTNAHVVVEEAPQRQGAASEPRGVARTWHLVLVSAATPTALETATGELADFLADSPELDLTDAAYTLQIGRNELAHRRMAVCRDRRDAVESLRGRDPKRLRTSSCRPHPRPCVFLFPGGGTQYAGMGRELYEQEPSFRQRVASCAEHLEPRLGLDLRAALYPEQGRAAEGVRLLRQVRFALPALFVTEFALARLWMSWGVRPAAMIGHSLGEYVAACLAGVLSLEDALDLVVLRSRLFERLPRGAMLSVPLPEDEARALVDGRLSLAAVNGPAHCVVAGPADRVAELRKSLAGRGLDARPVAIRVAAHSSLVDPVLDEFGEGVSKLRLEAPRVAFLSGVTGTWITPAEATDPGYWVEHLRRTVRFADCLSRVREEQEDRILLEVGPGQTLTTLARQLPDLAPSELLLSSLPHARDPQPAAARMHETVGRLWLSGTAIDWSAYHGQELGTPAPRRRVELPTYPFERRRYWLEPRSPRPGPRGGDRGKEHGPRRLYGKQADAGDWTYLLTWRRSRRATLLARAGPVGEEHPAWLLFVDEAGLGRRLAERLKRDGRRILTAEAGELFARLDHDRYALAPGSSADFETLLRALAERGALPGRITYLWSVDTDGTAAGEGAAHRALERGFFGLLYLARAWARSGSEHPLLVDVVTTGLHEVTGEEVLCPEKAALLGPVRVWPIETPAVTVRTIDLTPCRSRWESVPELLWTELRAGPQDPVVALRGRHRWVPELEKASLAATRRPPARLRERGVYLVTGGLGGLGLVVARHLAEVARAKLVLVARSAFPTPGTWTSWLRSHAEEDPVNRKIRQLRALEETGAEVLVERADVSDPAGMAALVERARERFGRIHGVVHAAGIVGGSMIRFETPENLAPVFAAKIAGTRVLEALFRDEPRLDFLVLCSSVDALRGTFGSVAYCAANNFLDAFAHHNALAGETLTVSINWCAWQQVGRAAEEAARAGFRGRWQESVERGLLPAEGVEVLSRVLAHDEMQVIVSTTDLREVLDQDRSFDLSARLAEVESELHGGQLHPRRAIDTPYVAPRNDLEQSLAEMWQELLGFDHVGVQDDFFELGGHSLLATRILSRLRQRYGAELSIEHVFKTPTVAELADFLATRAAGPAAVLTFDDDLEEGEL